MGGAATPRMHGLTHGVGGPDPIPGLGTGGGGALEWEDDGAIGPGTPLREMFQETLSLTQNTLHTNLWIFSGGDALFDLTAPAAPKAIAAGLYAIYVSWNLNGPGAAGEILEVGCGYSGLADSGFGGNFPDRGTSHATAAFAVGSFTTWLDPAHTLNAHCLISRPGGASGFFSASAIRIG